MVQPLYHLHLLKHQLQHQTMIRHHIRTVIVVAAVRVIVRSVENVADDRVLEIETVTGDVVAVRGDAADRATGRGRGAGAEIVIATGLHLRLRPRIHQEYQ
ncbi:hypothetical protein ANCDUO_26677 [Ancylostoma duodenale]|uniref:Uncharacterized protein n=1 Tax=Ancylostoma duodenale TaxID=51022 RepID=A0A0C2FE60_9BILA|nr:hypothetical protein ANCDUO_26677 [Ancylostoma duodenale]